MAGSSKVVTMPLPGRARNLTTIGVIEPPRDPEFLDAGPGRHRCDPAREGGELVEIGRHRRPDVQPHVVHVQSRAAGPRRSPGATDPLETVRDGALEMREGDNVAGLVAGDAELAHLGQREEPLVGGVSLGLALEQQDIGRPLEAGQGGVAQPPEGEAAPDPRVGGAGEEGRRERRLPGGAEGEVAHLAGIARGHPDGDAAHGVGDRQGSQGGGQLSRRLVIGGGRLWPVQVEVDDALDPFLPRLDLRREVGGELAVGSQLVVICDGAHQV